MKSWHPWLSFAPRSWAETNAFDRDPGWEASGNRAVPARFPTVTQDFGYSQTAFAAKSIREMGG